MKETKTSWNLHKNLTKMNMYRLPLSPPPNELIENADNTFQGTSDKESFQAQNPIKPTEKSKQINKGPQPSITSVQRVSNYLNTTVRNCNALYMVLICVL